MFWLFASLCALYVLLMAVKLGLALRYWGEHHYEMDPDPGIESRFSVVQPILSGDRFLEENLRENLANHPNAHFVWLIDTDDPVAGEIVQRIREDETLCGERLEVIEVPPVPQGKNPKIFKMKAALPSLREKTVVLDDDTVIPPGTLSKAYGLLQSEERLLTGLPHYRTQKGFFSDLVAGFVNANALFLYLPIAAINDLNTINGMFYITTTETLRGLNAFEAIEDRLCDDYEIARLYQSNGIPLYQSVLPCKIVTEVRDGQHYLKLMKRWMVFVNQFTRENLSPSTLTLVLTPSFLPALLTGLSLSLGFGWFCLFLAVHLSKLALFSWVKSQKTGTPWAPQVLVFEWLSEYLQLLHYVHATLSPRRIQWRTRDIDLSEDSIRYRT